MPEMRRYRCNNCDERFEVVVPTEQERREAEEKRDPIKGFPIHCPKCKRQDYRKGWD